jgi:hypothetical protein
LQSANDVLHPHVPAVQLWFGPHDVMHEPQ